MIDFAEFVKKFYLNNSCVSNDLVIFRGDNHKIGSCKRDTGQQLHTQEIDVRYRVFTAWPRPRTCHKFKNFFGK